MDLREFAGQHRLNTKKDVCCDTIISGKNQGADTFLLARVKAGRTPDRVEFRSHIFDGYDNGQLGVCLMYGTARKFRSVKRQLEAGGFVVKQEGDTEGIFTFDPANAKQSRLAIQMAKVKIRRIASPAQLAVLEQARTKLPTSVAA